MKSLLLVTLAVLGFTLRNKFQCTMKIKTKSYINMNQKNTSRMLIIQIYLLLMSPFIIFSQPNINCSLINIPIDNLAGYWPLNGNALDYSSNGKHGNVVGAIPSLDRFGIESSAFFFDGINDFIQISDGFSSLSNFTISGWFSSYENQGGSFIYLGSNGSCCGCDGVGIGIGDGDTWFNSGNNLVLGGCNGLNWMGTEIQMPPIQTWNHFALIKKTGSIQFLINGISVYYDFQGEALLESTSIYLGAASTAGDYAFKGSMDDIYFYERALSTEEIVQLFMSQNGQSANINYQGPVTISPNGSVELSAATNLQNYQWNFNGLPINMANNPTLMVSDSGFYSLTIDNLNGCQFTTPEILVTQSAIEFSCSLPNYIPTNGLIGFWPFCGNANDISGNNNDGIISGAELTTDRYNIPNSAFQFNGSKNCILVKDALNNFNTVTISGWYNSSSDQGATFSYIGINSPNLGCNGFGAGQGNDVWFTSGNYLHSSSSCSGGWHPTSYQLPPSGDWIHFAMSKSDSLYRVYINGEIAQEFIGANEDFISNTVFFGSSSTRGDYSFSGKLDDISLHNRVLNQAEIYTMFNTSLTVINPQNNSNTIKVFPNPAGDHITIDYGNFATINGYQLKIQNSIGQKIFQTNITQQINYLSLSNLGGNGLYFLHTIDAQGNTIDIRKIVLQ